MRIWTIIFLLLIILRVPVEAKDHGRFHAYTAFGTAYGLGSIRLGSGQWEAGMLTPFMWGFDRIFDLNDNVYTSWGFGVSIGGFGIYSGLGYYKKLFWIFDFRTELAAQVDMRGYTYALGTLGLSYNF